ncbi:MAG: UbiX family flavin prenyltransferase [Nitrospirae bacterium]|nr:UbiX family flavin prenyltransferase [Nitrospirota bacterium]
MKKYVLGITGASGSILGIRVAQELLKTAELHITISSQAFSIIKDEVGLDLKAKTERETEKRLRKHFSTDRLFYWAEGNMESPIASGSFRTDGMLVVPCSMKTLSGIANGYANTLIERTADVTIKEGRTLLLCPREMPLSCIHLENMLKLARIGVRIAPPVMGFYHNPESLGEMVDFIAGKILDAIGINHNLFKRWEGYKPQKKT